MALKFYTVVGGDNLSTIGQKLGVPWQQIASFNKLGNPNKIKPGEVLMIPEPEPPAPEPKPSAPPAPPAPGLQLVDNIEVRPREPEKDQLPQRAQDLLTGPQAHKPEGSIENIKETTKPYPPGPGQMAYGSFWADFLDKSLPTALMGASGPGAPLMRAVAKLKDFEQYPYAEPNAKRADFYRKAGRMGGSEDPNYGQVFEKGNQLSGAKPEAYSGPPMEPPAGVNRVVGPEQGGMSLGDFIKYAGIDMIRRFIGRPSSTLGDRYNPVTEGEAIKMTARQRNESNMTSKNLDEGLPRNEGPGSSFAKGTTVSKSGASNPLGQAIQKGMEKRLKEHGYQVAGDVIDINRKKLSQQDKYNQALDQQRLNRLVHSLLKKPEGSWTDEDIALVKSLLGDK